MFRRFSINFALFSMLMDAIVVCASLAIATGIRPSLGFIPFAAEFPFFVPTPAWIYIVFATEWVAIFLLFSVYDARRSFRGTDEFLALTMASVLAAVALAGTLYLSVRNVSRLLFLMFIILAYLGMLGWRLAAHYLLRSKKDRPERQQRVLIVGAGSLGEEVLSKVNENPQYGLNILGFLDDNPTPRNNLIRILGSIDYAESIVQQHQVDDVIIALPQKAYKRINQLVGDLHRLPVKVWVIPDYFRVTLYKAAIEDFAGIPLLDLRAPALNEYQRMVKRAFDLVITALSMPLILPIMGIIVLGIRLGSPGKILLKQPRAGENGRDFDMLKFRTMVADAENFRHLVEHVDENGHLIHKTSDDPRVTSFGRFLRRYSLDELPQFFNVLKGEMSLVGPRPELPYLVAQYEPWQRQRFSVPQGLTGWWQIHGRSDRPMHLNTEDDLYYIQNYSLFLDIYILIKSIGVVLQGKGAF
jgi:exopolysaccharide biosynthesis polyprenyl glycosylphosphotransferase